MLFAHGAFGLVLLGLWIFCLIDVITTDAANMRNLPKAAWIVIVLILPDIGSVLWLVAGRTWQAGPGARTSQGSAAYPEYDRPGRYVPTNPEDDEAFLRGVRDRAEQQRRRYSEQRRRELQAEQERLLKKAKPDPREEPDQSR